MDPDSGPRELLNKVQFDVRYFFCRRGSENIYTMTKETYQIGYDEESGITCILKAKDECTKNHQETNNPVLTGYMPEIIGSDGKPHKMCLVRSFKSYIDKLNELCPYLWQSPNYSGYKKGGKWLKNSRIGEAMLGAFMSELSKDAKLSKRYTNHCIRVTGTTNLTRANFSANQIMSVTGHKSVNSLAMYQCVASNEKMLMGASLAFNLMRPNVVQQQIQHMSNNRKKEIACGVPKVIATETENAVILKTPVEQNITSHPSLAQNNNFQQALVPVMPEEEPNASNIDFDILDFIADTDDNDILLAAIQMEKAMENENKSTTTSTKTVMKISTAQCNKTQSLPTFMNCKFGNTGAININVYKQ